MARRIKKEKVVVKMALKHEHNKNIVRLPQIIRTAIGVDAGDKVIVKNKKAEIIRLVVKATPEEAGEKIIGLDKRDREILNVSLGDTVEVFKSPEAAIVEHTRPDRSIWLFCYGSNNPKQLGERLQRKIDVQVPAYITGYHRVFRGFSRTWEGGVATLQKVADIDAATYGYATLVSADDLLRLDHFEGVAIGAYRREILKIILVEDGTERYVDAVAYLCNNQTFNEPSLAYLKAIVKSIAPFWKADDGSTVKVKDIPIRNS